jgi:hypothetical protein
MNPPLRSTALIMLLPQNGVRILMILRVLSNV